MKPRLSTKTPSAKARTVRPSKVAQQAPVLSASNPVARAQRLAQAGAPLAQPSLVRRLDMAQSIAPIGAAQSPVAQPVNPMALPANATAQPIAAQPQQPAQPRALRPQLLPPMDLAGAIHMLAQLRNVSKPE